MTSITKETKISSLLSMAGSLIVLLPVAWFLIKPLIATALAEDIKEVVQEEVAPISDAFTVLLQRDINSLRKEIAQLKFRQRQGVDWTSEDATYLAELEIELEALRDAREKLEKEEEAS